VNEGGWQIYQMPDTALPWGIAFEGGNIYVVDNGRQMLVKLPAYLNNVFLPLITR